MINNINGISQNMNQFKLNKEKILFVSSESEILKFIKNYGSIYSKKKNMDNYNPQKINVNINGFNPKNLKCIKKLCNNCGYGGNCYVYDGICFFISKKKEHVLGYSDFNSINKSIIFYDINNNNEIKTIKNAHYKSIHIIKYYNYPLYDLILSSSCDDDIKLWNYNDCSNIMTISQIFNDTSNGVFSSCVILEEKISYILCVGNFKYIKVYDSSGNFYGNLGNKDEDRRFIDIYEINDNKYIFTGGNKGIMVFNYPNFTEYYRFIENYDTYYHNYAKIIKVNDTYNLIDIGYFNKIKIWDFFNKNLIFCIESNSRDGLAGVISINDRYLILGSENGSIKEFDLEKRSLIANFEKQHSKSVLGVKIIKDKNEKNFLISYGLDQSIFLWGLE